MAIFICKKCGSEVETRCRPPKCKNCGADKEDIVKVDKPK